MAARPKLKLVSRTENPVAPRPRPGARAGLAADAEPDHRNIGALAALIFMLVLVGVGFLLTLKLRDMSHQEDCLLQGRTNCSPIERPVQKN